MVTHNIVIRKILPSTLVFVLFFMASQVSAACVFETGGVYGTMQTVAIPLKVASISVPPDTPTGTVIYQQSTNVTTANSMTLSCSSSGAINIFYEMDSTPLATGYSNIYQTNIAGIGVQYSVGSNIFPTSVPVSQVTSISNSVMASFQPAKLDVTIKLIKTTANVAVGNFNLISLPNGAYSAGRVNDKAPYYKFSFTGMLQINAPTCDISPASASMTVQMGSYLNTSFTGSGSGSAWKNASINLTNCPQFYGNSSTSVGTYTGGTSFSNAQPLTANSMELSLTPLNGINSSDPSIMNIDGGAGSATGLGIQLSTSESASDKINLNNTRQYGFPMSYVIGSYTIPLYARYVQTDTTVTSGTAKGRLEYTITYH